MVLSSFERTRPVARSHSVTVPWRSPNAMRAPSREYLTASTSSSVAVNCCWRPETNSRISNSAAKGQFTTVRRERYGISFVVSINGRGADLSRLDPHDAERVSGHPGQPLTIGREGETPVILLIAPREDYGTNQASALPIPQRERTGKADGGEAPLVGRKRQAADSFLSWEFGKQAALRAGLKAPSCTACEARRMSDE